MNPYRSDVESRLNDLEARANALASSISANKKSKIIGGINKLIATVVFVVTGSVVLYIVLLAIGISSIPEDKVLSSNMWSVFHPFLALMIGCIATFVLAVAWLSNGTEDKKNHR